MPPISGLGRARVQINDITIDTGAGQVRPTPTGILINTPGGEVPLETTIVGLTGEPILLRGFFSQTLSFYHHPASLGTYIFEPRLEPEIAPTQLLELKRQNIRSIYIATAEEGFVAQILGFDDKFRPLTSTNQQ